MNNKRYVTGLFDDEDLLLSGIKNIQNSGIKIHDVFTPYPIHGLENILKIPTSRLPIAAFCFGCLGISCAFFMMWYMITYDWPMDIGGKPNFPLVSFVPILFEWTVLFASFGMGFTFCIANRFYPGAQPVILEERATNDRFVIAVKTTDQKSEDELIDLLNNSGAVDIKFKQV